MKKNIIILFVALFMSLILLAQKNNWRSFLPADYDTLYGGVAEGDLNGDGKKDLVLALFHKMEKEQVENIDVENIPPRKLLVLFGAANGYRNIIATSKAILCKDCGGVFGDPFNGISIEKNVLIISHYGGSAWRWGLTHKFRFQKNAFFLIGKTTHSYWNVEHCDELGDFAGTDYEDINFLTGQYERKKISEDCKLLENKKGKQKVKQLVSLSKFDIEN